MNDSSIPNNSSSTQVNGPQVSKSESPLLVGRRELAKQLSISLPTLDRLDSSGNLPQAVRLGGRKLWRLEEIREWVSVNCPPRIEWEAIWASMKQTKRRKP
jgi:predicted DNA-binding transcriptional regulator AlpA